VGLIPTIIGIFGRANIALTRQVKEGYIIRMARALSQ